MTGLSNLPPGCTDMDIERAAGWKPPRRSASGRKFTKRGCNQDKITDGTLLRSTASGNRISIVRGRWKDYLVCQRFCDTARANVRRPYEYSPLFLMSRGTLMQHEVVREITV